MVGHDGRHRRLHVARNRRAARTSIRAPISSRSASCSTRWPPGRRAFRARRPPWSSTASSIASRRRRARSTRRFPRSSIASSPKRSKRIATLRYQTAADMRADLQRLSAIPDRAAAGGRSSTVRRAVVCSSPAPSSSYARAAASRILRRRPSATSRRRGRHLSEVVGAASRPAERTLAGAAADGSLTTFRAPSPMAAGLAVASSVAQTGVVPACVCHPVRERAAEPPARSDTSAARRSAASHGRDTAPTAATGHRGPRAVRRSAGRQPARASTSRRRRSGTRRRQRPARTLATVPRQLAAPRQPAEPERAKPPPRERLDIARAKIEQQPARARARRFAPDLSSTSPAAPPPPKRRS